MAAVLDPDMIGFNQIQNILKKYLLRKKAIELDIVNAHTMVEAEIVAQLNDQQKALVEQDLQQIFLGRKLWLQQEREKILRLLNKKTALSAEQETDLQNLANRRLINPTDNSQNVAGTEELRNLQAQSMASATTASAPQTGFMAGFVTLIGEFFTMIFQMFTGLQKMLNPEKTPAELLRADNIEQAYTAVSLQEQELLAKLDALEADITPGTRAALVGANIQVQIARYRAGIANLDGIWKDALSDYKRKHLVHRIQIVKDLSTIVESLEKAHEPIKAAKALLREQALEKAALEAQQVALGATAPPALSTLLVDRLNLIQTEIAAQTALIENNTPLDLEETRISQLELTKFNTVLIPAFQTQLEIKKLEEQRIAKTVLEQADIDLAAAVAAVAAAGGTPPQELVVAQARATATQKAAADREEAVRTNLAPRL